MFGNLSGPTLLVILFIVLLLFGAPKLPGLAKSIGQSMKILKKEVRGDDAGDAPDQSPAAPADSAPKQAPTQEPAADAKPNDPDAGGDKL